ncbi:MAG: PAS domain S-box protein [Saccharospirillaceae bacterium]|nr:ATP-binding protein [Pseudomonadales bacterium]NRB81175.1 PAS domain S-box protein [Saccharospirillaceae bacterium]
MLKVWYTSLPITRKIFFMFFVVLTSVIFFSVLFQFVSYYSLTYKQLVKQNEQAVVYLIKNQQQHLGEGKQNIDISKVFPSVKVVGVLKDGYWTQRFPANANLPNPSQIPSNTVRHKYYFGKMDEQHKIYIQTNTLIVTHYKSAILWASLATLIFALICMIFAGIHVQRVISRPILHLMNIARMVSNNENYQVRAQKMYEDEIGGLVDAFNTMLARVENRDHQLHAEKNRAERAQNLAENNAEQTKEAVKRLEFEVHVRTKIERKLTDFQSYLNSIINSMPSALIAVDEHFFVTQWNKEATTLSGTSIEYALGYSLEEAFPLLGDYMDIISRALLEKETQVRERIEYSLNDQKLFLDFVVYPLNRTGTLGAVIRIDDITERTKLEEVMVQTEKMMSVGGLAAGMAHEINNPLSAIIQGSQNIKRRLDPSLAKNVKVAEALNVDLSQIKAYLNEREIIKFMDNIHSAGQRAAHIVTNMLQFSRQSSRKLDMHNICELLDRAIEIASSDYDLKNGYDFKQLEIIKEYSDEQLQIPCAAPEIEQVLLNLIKNAAQALKEREINSFVEHKSSITIACTTNNNQCILSISDNGTGMEDSVRKRIFEPFFTTKDVGIGTGLGLSVSYFIITSHHNGTMNVTSTLGEGSKFTICLPLEVIEA